MIKIDKEAFAKDEFFSGSYTSDKEYVFTVTSLKDFNTDSVEYVVTWLDRPENYDKIEEDIIIKMCK